VTAKLVRDRIPALVRAAGGPGAFRRANPEELRLALRAKLDEEVAEFDAAASPEERLTELADVLEVVYALAASSGISASALDLRRAEKAAERGAFDESWILERPS
jgi:predicted house-cleaning noncanonical NTP pyrophosphatase (MazG superfamily)